MSVQCECKTYSMLAEALRSILASEILRDRINNRIQILLCSKADRLLYPAKVGDSPANVLE